MHSKRKAEVGGVRPFARAAGTVLTVFAASVGWCVEATAQSLDDALASAYTSNPTLLAARAELRRADEQVSQALSGWRPQADFSGGGGYVAGGSDNKSNRTNLSSSNGEAILLDFRVRQPIYNFATQASVKQAENAVRAQRARLTAVEQDVLLRSIAAYMDVIQAEAMRKLNSEHAQVLDRQLDSLRHRFSLGEIRNTDVAQSEASAARATAQRTQAENDLMSAREAYRALIGETPGTLVMPDRPKDLPATEDEAVAGSVANPNVVAADYAERAAKDGVDVSFGQELPQLNLQGDVQASTASVLGVVSIPLARGGALDSQVRGAKQLVGQRRLEADAQRRDARRAAMSAWQALQTASANTASFRAQVRAAQLAADGVRREQRLGLRTVTDALDAEERLLEAQTSLAGAERDTIVATYRVLAADGRLTARDLDLDVPYYDANKHYHEVRGKLWGTGPALE